VPQGGFAWHAPGAMRALAILLVAAIGCAATDDDDAGPVDARRIEFLVPGTYDPLPAHAAVEIYLRSQGDWGATLDMRVYGVPLAEQAKFIISLVGPTHHQLAAMNFLPTHTAKEQDDGSFTVAMMPVVFLEDVAKDEVDDAPATMSVMMMCEPPATGELEVTLELQ
jgi:hypothetical protein